MDLQKKILAIESQLLKLRKVEGSLHCAVECGSNAVLAALLFLEFPVNKGNCHGETPLHIAARNNDVIAVKLLLKAGANPNTADIFNKTPLMLAASGGFLFLTELLLEAGAEKAKK